MIDIHRIILWSHFLILLQACSQEPCDQITIDGYALLSERYELCLDILDEDPRPYPGVSPYTQECIDCYSVHSAPTEEGCTNFISCVEELCIILGELDGRPPDNCN